MIGPTTAGGSPMPRSLLGLAAAAALALPTGLGAAEPIKVVIIDGQNNHVGRAPTPFLKQVLESSGRFTVDVAPAPSKPQLRQGTTEEDRQKQAEAQELYRKQMTA